LAASPTHCTPLWLSSPAKNPALRLPISFPPGLDAGCLTFPDPNTLQQLVVRSCGRIDPPISLVALVSLQAPVFTGSFSRGEMSDRGYPIFEPRPYAAPSIFPFPSGNISTELSCPPSPPQIPLVIGPPLTGCYLTEWAHFLQQDVLPVKRTQLLFLPCPHLSLATLFAISRAANFRVNPMSSHMSPFKTSASPQLRSTARGSSARIILFDAFCTVPLFHCHPAREEDFDCLSLRVTFPASIGTTTTSMCVCPVTPVKSEIFSQGGIPPLHFPRCHLPACGPRSLVLVRVMDFSLAGVFLSIRKVLPPQFRRFLPF